MTEDVRLRAVRRADLEIFFEHQLDPEASHMAAFPSRDRDAHFAHWDKIGQDETKITRTIVVGEDVAGNIGSWVQDGEREIGYWIGKAYWGRGIATSAVQQLLREVQERPLFAWVAEHNTGSIRVLEKTGFAFDRAEDDHRVYRFE